MGKLEFKRKSSIRAAVTKFGGAPYWIGDPQWPLSRSTGNPMRFLCQVALPNDKQFGGQRMAYIFMTDPEPGGEYVDGTWEPEYGENAVILQPSPFDPIVKTTDLTYGPTLQVPVDGKPGLLDRIMGVKQSPRRRYEDVELKVIETEKPCNLDSLGSKLTGEPDWLQNDETPTKGDWRFFLQMDNTSESNDYSINFGDAGIGYAFIRTDGRAARFLWQCC